MIRAILMRMDLIGSLPPIDGPRRRLTAIAGTVPDPKAMPHGCAFAPRCVHAAALCGTTRHGFAPLVKIDVSPA